MINKKLTLTLVAGVLILGIPVTKVLADCQPTYGGGQTCTDTIIYTVSKDVQSPKTSQFSSNLQLTEAFSPDSTVPFRITVRNNGTKTLHNIAIYDSLPQYLTFSSGDGSYNSSNNQVQSKIDQLDPGKSKEIFIYAKVAQANSIPDAATCLTNSVTAKPDDVSQQSASANFCIKKGSVLGATKGGAVVYAPQPVKVTPSTGAESLALLGLFSTALTGLFLRKQTNK